jgi:hypothetical protein
VIIWFLIFGGLIGAGLSFAGVGDILAAILGYVAATAVVVFELLRAPRHRERQAYHDYRRRRDQREAHVAQERRLAERYERERRS